jgi:hypothetical protein
MTRRARRLGIASMAVSLALAPQAVAAPKAKFRVVSVRGREALSFQEDGTTSTGDPCVGTTTSEVRWRSTRPVIVYVFVYRYGKKLGTSLTTDRRGDRYGVVRLPGKATLSRSVSYSETAGCDEEPTNCPEITAPATPFITGLFHGPSSVNGGIDEVQVPRAFPPSCRGAGEIAFGVSLPFGNAAMATLFDELRREPTAAWAVPRRRLFDRSRRRIHDSVTVEQPLAATTDPRDARQATISGTYTDHLEITLRRLRLR